MSEGEGDGEARARLAACSNTRSVCTFLGLQQHIEHTLRRGCALVGRQLVPRAPASCGFAIQPTTNPNFIRAQYPQAACVSRVKPSLVSQIGLPSHPKHSITQPYLIKHFFACMAFATHSTSQSNAHVCRALAFCCGEGVALSCTCMGGEEVPAAAALRFMPLPLPAMAAVAPPAVGLHEHGDSEP